MLRGLLASAGLSPDVLAQLPGLGQRINREVAGLTASLQLEHGKVSGCELIPHNPAQLPAMRLLDLPAGESVTLDVEQILTKTVTRGHVANVGGSELLVSWQGAAGDQWSEAYCLPAGAVLDTSSFAYRKLRVESVDTDGRLQVFGQ